jgi:apolipoprotein N-acyltransferase
MVKNNTLRWLLYGLGAAISFGLAWVPFNITPLIFVSFFLLLLLEQEMRLQKIHTGIFVSIIVISNLCLNLFTTYWIWNASPGGGVFAWIFDTFLMTIPWWIFYGINKKQQRANYWFFIALWIGVELLHTRWQFAYPWLTLGNVFAAWPQIIQWYEYTGVFGGSLWVLLVSVAALKIYNFKKEFGSIPTKKIFNQLFIYILAPLFLSFYILNGHHNNNATADKSRKAEITIVQPNFDPYEKFESIAPYQQMQQILNLTASKLNPTTHIALIPETAITEDIDERNFNQNNSVNLLDTFINNHAGLSILSGASTFKFYFDKNEVTPTARFYQDNIYYDYYNTAVFKNSQSNWQVYHKSKLVPGVENMPYVNVFSFLKKFVINLGGTSGGLGKDKEPSNFTDVNKVQYAPVICYESVFGEYVTDYVKKGANVICIITNDAWWGNTAGYRQHFEYAKLRAIENRRYVARSANTGISGFIDDEGNTIQKTKWNEATAINGAVKVNYEITFYTKYGDCIAYMAAIYLLFNLPALLVRRKK